VVPGFRNKTLKTTGVTIEDTEMENCLCKVKFTSAEGCMAHGHSMHEGAGNLSLLTFLIQLTLPLDLDCSRSKVHSLLDWLSFYANLGEGLR
jgi:hypothetical protein